MKTLRLLLFFSIIFIYTGCEKKEDLKDVSIENKQTNSSDRWYNQEMVQKGNPIYQKNCSSCHGVNAEGVILPWNKSLGNGKYPPPPLNNDAHAWHHPLKVLRFTIREGGKPVGGDMPPFKEKLSDNDINNIIAYFQNFWTDEYYEEWLRRGGLSK